MNTSLARAGKLDRAGEEAHGSSDSSSKNESSSSSSSASGDEDSEIGAELFYLIVTLPWAVPHAIVEEDRPSGSASKVRFASHPYADGERGLFVERGKPVAVQTNAETGFDPQGSIWRHELGVRVQFPWRLEVDSDWSLYREPVADGTEQLVLGREHLALRFAESSVVQFRTGIGAQHLAHDEAWEHGVDVNYGFEAFPVRPLVISGQGSLGSLGHAFAPGFEFSSGVLLGPLEINLGWNHRQVGSVALSGPCAGLRLWL